MKPAEHRCAACDEPLTPPAGRGRPARFCGAACRMAAQRRRRRGMPEALPRWAHARGRLSLDRAADWEVEAVTRALARQQRLAGYFVTHDGLIYILRKGTVMGGTAKQFRNVGHSEAGQVTARRR